MREIDIDLNRNAYLAGGRVNGTVTVRTDEYFDCDDFYVYVRGDEKTRISVGSGDDRRTYRGYTRLVEHKLDINDIRKFGAGETSMDFTFVLPNGLPPTYKGTGARIRYWMHAKAEISWSLDPEQQREFWVFSPGTRAKSTRHTASDEHEGQKALEIQLKEPIIRLGDTIPFRFQVASGIEARGVRAELVHCQDRKARGHSRRTQNVLVHREIPETEIQRDRWIDWSVPTRQDFPPTFRTRLITSWYFLKVTLDRPWRFDKSACLTVVPYFEPR